MFSPPVLSRPETEWGCCEGSPQVKKVKQKGEEIICESEKMKSKMTTNVFKAHTVLWLLTLAVFVTAVPKTTTAKSLYIIADLGFLGDATQPVQVYDIGADGKLTFQAQHDIPHIMLGAVGIAIDSDNGYLFITYEASESVQLLEAETMTDAGSLIAPDAEDLAGIVYDHDKMLVYCVDRGESRLYVYQWNPSTVTLSHAPDSPVELFGAAGYGIALDEINDLLYVANATNTVNIYNTSNWLKVGRVKLDRTAISVAVDPQRSLLYTGAGYAGNKYLTQYDLVTGTIKEVQVEPDAGVMGLGVDQDTGYVYLNTGANNEPGGDNLQAYDAQLHLIDEIHVGGNPTGLVVPTKDISFNPLGLRKTALRGASHSGASGAMPTVGVGDTLTYGIHFNNFTGGTVADISIVDTLPSEVEFVSADDDGVSGSYDPKAHAYTWSYSTWPPNVPMTLELAVKVRGDVETGTVISNTVTIDSDRTPPTTKRLDVVAGHNPLNLTKGILGSPQDQMASVSANSNVTYTIQFENNNDFTVTNVTVLDALPKEVSFVSAQKGAVPGKYNQGTHSCSWSFASLEPGEAVYLELIVRVDEDLAKGTIFTNSVTVESEETPTATALVDAIIGDTPSTVPQMKILPRIIRRNSESYNIQVSFVFPPGIGTDDVTDVLPMLHPGQIKAKQQFIYGSSDRAKVIALFDKNKLLEAVKGYGEITLRMTGSLTSGRTYAGEGTVTITKYSGH